MMTDETSRKNSLRLKNFDYSRRRCYFVTIVCFERHRYFADPTVANAAMRILLSLRLQHGFKLYSFVFMPDHFHAVIGLGDSGLTLGGLCGSFKSLTTREFWKYGEGKLWQRQYFDHIVRNEEDFCECVGYVRGNPLRKKLVDDLAKWPYYGEPDLLEAIG
jgi:REP element-mobilizing transposase RayT